MNSPAVVTATLQCQGLMENEFFCGIRGQDSFVCPEDGWIERRSESE